MKKYVLVLSAIVVLVLASCQKEIDWGLGGSNEQMLVMVIPTIARKD
jgi:hypothetical protein